MTEGITYHSKEACSRHKVLWLPHNAGVGHIAQADTAAAAMQLFDSQVMDPASALLPHLTAEEARDFERLDYLNDIFPTRVVPSRLNSLGQHLTNASMNYVFGLADILQGDGPDLLPITYHYESRLARPYAEMVKSTGATAVVTTLSVSARMANEAKAQGFLPADLPVIACVFDPLGPKLTWPIYDYKTRHGIDPYSDLIVADEVTKQVFLDRGHDQNRVHVMDGRYYPTDENRQHCDGKLHEIGYLAKHGPDPSCPARLGIVHDNFETSFENSLSRKLPAEYSELVNSGALHIFTTLEMTCVQDYLDWFQDKFPDAALPCVVTDSDCLQAVLADQRSGNVIVVKPGHTQEIRNNTDYATMQEALLQHVHLAVTRPSELPRTAARYATPTFLTVPFMSQEAYMRDVFTNAGISGSWTQLARSRFNRMRRNMKGLQQLDLAESEAWQAIARMALQNIDSGMHSSPQGAAMLVEQILSRK